MQCFFDYTDTVDKQKIDRRFMVVGENITLSTGDSLEVKSTYSTDGSNHSQAITRRVRNTALGASLKWTVTHRDLLEENWDLFNYIAEAEGLCGRVVRLTFDGQTFPPFIVKSVGFSATVDALDIYSQVSIAIELNEGHVRKKTVFTEVNTFA